MQDKIKILTILVFMTLLFINDNVYGYTGKGTKSNPYIVSNEKDLREVLCGSDKKESWTYIGINRTISIRKTIKVQDGKYRIYATGKNRTIKRSSDLSDAVNDLSDSKYCMKITGVKTQVVLGYNVSDYKLTLDGQSKMFTGKMECSGWFHISDCSSLTIGVKCCLINTKNNKYMLQAAPITSWGNVTIDGEISNCQGINGGAIKSLQGTVIINSGAGIHNCRSETEGGAVYAMLGGDVTMKGGSIYNCESKEEGGAIFVKGTAKCNLLKGYIKNNYAGSSAGGVFVGYGATLSIGDLSGSGPEIAYNTSIGSGGGVRCNGGESELAGGITYIYGANIHHNTSGKFGGGIACGEAGDKGKSKIVIRNVSVCNNVSESDGGGVWIPKGAIGTESGHVLLDNCKINNNYSYKNGGGIMIHSSVFAQNNIISENISKNNGGAVYDGKEGNFTIYSGTISQNKSDGLGSGIYVRGKLKMLSDACVDENNDVYLTLNTYIDIIGRLKKTSGYIAKIDSESKTNGTILIKADYTGASAAKELYYSGDSQCEYEEKAVVKKYCYKGLKKNRCLRPSERVNGYDAIYIILSEKYKISYDANTTDNVEDMPKKQIKFWRENIEISSNTIIRKMYITDSKIHWNTEQSGKGLCIYPKSIYSYDGDKTLYAQWEKIKTISIMLVKGQSRFISDKYLNTLDDKSRWNTELRTILEETLRKTEGQGLYKINISKQQIKNIKNDVKKSNYVIDRHMNNTLIGELEI